MMKLKLIATAAAALLASGTAQAQTQEWYLTGADGTDTALVFVERFSVSMQGNTSTVQALILRIDDAKGEELAALSTLAFDCKAHNFKIVTLQPLDQDAKPMGQTIQGKGEDIDIGADSFYDGALKFACGGSTKPDPQLLIGSRPPVQAGSKYLRDQQAENAKK